MTTMPSTLASMERKLESDAEFRQRFESDPVGVTKEAAKLSQLPNTLVYRMVVGALGLGLLIALIAAAAITLLSAGATDVPNIFITAASTIIGALAGLLAPQPQS
ncbi:hypothetical protein ACOXXX_21000 [Thalassococcus sp. BH17M4-6]|uniref:hypothetical protein n=1 Tax=Thalassococcus sp. BH17M4-6 TaxID=3413148 RepID=UPI003BCACD3D